MHSPAPVGSNLVVEAVWTPGIRKKDDGHDLQKQKRQQFDVFLSQSTSLSRAQLVGDIKVPTRKAGMLMAVDSQDQDWKLRFPMDHGVVFSIVHVALQR